ncbi:Der1-like family protein [Nitzschia inconspicua]|uniref:Derlin n=1 Tax=Nitzschia inconspicua TaxID=303405 RepID=A0A9K3KEC4_9STRA|nr:Der1-like family protein [Nitzschia inconspicua]
MRGGASKRKSTSAAKTVTGKKKLSKGKEDVESPMADLMAFLMTVPTFTRIYLYGMVFITVLGNLIGEERAHAIFSLDPMRVLFGMEIWRPLTAACFLGKPSMQWVTSLYSVFKYGSQLERSYKGAQFLVFLATTLFLSSMLSTVLGQPFIAQAVITSMLHVLARTTPNETVVWYVMKVPHFTLPYLNALTDCFNAQGSLAAMIPHIIGILAGHFYFFHKVLWPKMERGEDWLIAPDFLVEVVDGKDVTNKDKKKNKRKSGGRKLGSIAGTA